MAEKSIFEQIKKQNGEHFAKAIRGYDNGIFDIPGIVDIVKYAGREAEPIMEYLESLKQVQIEETGVYQDPITLLDAAGYNAYYVTSLEEQNKIEPYYATAEELKKMGIHPPSSTGEALCTFRDSTRFKNYHIINAVRKDVDQIRREDFKGKEKREDRYGTSVISIQILKSGGFISIKNRYNHSITNPDNTFNSNPDNIILGLSNAIRHHFDVDFSAQKVKLPNGYTFINNQIIKYNYEKDNIYFGSNFYVQDGVIHRLKSHEIMFNSYIFDLKTRTLTRLGALETDKKGADDTEFKRVFAKETEGYNIVLKKAENGYHMLLHKPKENGSPEQPDIDFLTIENGQITELNLPTTTEIKDDFLQNNADRLRSFTAPNLERMGDGCLNDPHLLTSLNLPKLKRLGNGCFINLYSLTTLDLPALSETGYKCFHSMYHLRSLNLPALTRVGWGFIQTNHCLKSIYLPSLTQMGDDCFCVSEVKKAYLPALTKMGRDCLRGGSFKSIILPRLSEVEHSCAVYAESLETFYAPLLKKRPTYFGTYMNPIRRTILWLKRKQKPKGYPFETGISATLQQAESGKRSSQSGISERLTQETQTPSRQQTPNTSFFNKLKKWFLPQK